MSINYVEIDVFVKIEQIRQVAPIGVEKDGRAATVRCFLLFEFIDKTPINVIFY